MKVFAHPLVWFTLALITMSASAPLPDQDREKVIEDFQLNYRGTTITDLGWTGSTNGCHPGKVDREVYINAAKRINYYRRLAGFEKGISFKQDYNEQAQAASLVMHANDILTHTPNKRMKCYTEQGYNGAYGSNIAQLIEGYYERLITDFLEDPGQHNAELGHRRWLLYSGSQQMGFGATPKYYAVHVTGKENLIKPTDGIPSKICWPPEGMVPFQLVYRRWSMGLPKDLGEIDFSRAQVKLTIKGKPLAAKIVSRDANYGDPTLIWEVPSMKEDFHYDYYNEITKKNALMELGMLEQPITVEITKVKIDGVEKQFRYRITPIDPDRS